MWCLLFSLADVASAAIVCPVGSTETGCDYYGINGLPGNSSYTLRPGDYTGQLISDGTQSFTGTHFTRHQSYASDGTGPVRIFQPAGKNLIVARYAAIAISGVELIATDPSFPVAEGYDTSITLTNVSVHPDPALTQWRGAIHASILSLSLNNVVIDGDNLLVTAPPGETPALIHVAGGYGGSHASIQALTVRNAPATGLWIQDLGSITLPIYNSTFDNLSSSDAGGAGVHLALTGMGVTASNNTFSNLSVTSSLGPPVTCAPPGVGCGGAVYVRTYRRSTLSRNVSFTSSVFIRNYADYDGGSIYFEDYTASTGIPIALTVNASVVRDGEAGHAGGALRVVSGKVLVDGSTFCRNRAASAAVSVGPAVRLGSALRNSTWVGNEGTAGAGALAAFSDAGVPVVLEHLDFAANSGAPSAADTVFSVKWSFFFQNSEPAIPLGGWGSNNGWSQPEPMPTGFGVVPLPLAFAWELGVPPGDCAAAAGLTPFSTSGLALSPTQWIGAYQPLPADFDGDGHGLIAAGGDDCDDNASSI